MGYAPMDGLFHGKSHLEVDDLGVAAQQQPPGSGPGDHQGVCPDAPAHKARDGEFEVGGSKCSWPLW